MCIYIHIYIQESCKGLKISHGLVGYFNPNFTRDRRGSPFDLVLKSLCGLKNALGSEPSPSFELWAILEVASCSPKGGSSWAGEAVLSMRSRSPICIFVRAQQQLA